MGKSRSAPTSGECVFEKIATELYALRPDAFAAARDAQVAAARADQAQGLARELSKLRRPTQSAWVVNLLWRDRPNDLEELFALAEDLRRTQASGGELQGVTTRRRELETAFIQRARALAQQADVTLTATMEREVYETLSAGLALPEVAAEVRSGRLVKPASYAGFGSLSAVAQRVAPRREVSPPRTAPAAVERSKAKASAKPAVDKAQRRVDEAQAAAETAAQALSEHEGLAEAAQQQEQGLLVKVQHVDEQLRSLKVDLAAARGAAVAASRRRDQAENVHVAALRALRAAQQGVERAGQ